MVNVKIDEEDLIDILMERLKYWTTDEEVLNLYRIMYENSAYDGSFDGMELDPMVIVDNDYVNNCGIVEEGDDNYKEIKDTYDNGEYDFGDGTIEAENNGVFLIRHY